MRARVITVIGAATIIVVAGIGLFFWKVIFPVVRGDITSAFASDLGTFVTDHEGKLPADWKEFCAWMKTNKQSQRWKETELAQRFTLLTTPLLREQSEPIYVKVIDPGLINLEGLINNRVAGARAALEPVGTKQSGGER